MPVSGVDFSWHQKASATSSGTPTSARHSSRLLLQNGQVPIMSLRLMQTLVGAFNAPHGSRLFHCSSVDRHIIKLTRLRVVDNSEIGKAAMMEGKPPRCIHVYNKVGVGTIGDKVLVAIKGEKKKAIIVGVKRAQKPFIPRFDTNNIVLVDDLGTPLGTRIHVPIPHILRTLLKEKNVGKGVDYTKLLALATNFV